MNLRRVTTLYKRDLRDAIRDGRVLVAIVIPVALALYYSIAIPDPTARPEATLTVVGDTDAPLVDSIREASKDTIKLTVRESDSRGDAESRAEDNASEVAIVVDGDAAEAGSGGTPLELLVPGDADAGGSVLASIVEQVAGRGEEPPPFAVERTVVNAEASGAFEELGIARALGLFGVVMLAGFIAFLVIPVLLVEEVALGTLEALQMVATTVEIIVAKVLVGMSYCAVAIGITMAAGDFSIERPVEFAAAALGLSLALTGFGLAFGLWMNDPGRVNTWSGVVLIPVLIPVFVVLGKEQPWRIAGELIPTGAGAQLLAAAVEPSVADPLLLPIAVLVGWTVAGFGLLWWLLERRSA